MKLSEDCMTAFQEHLTLTSSHLPITFTTLVLQVRGELARAPVIRRANGILSPIQSAAWQFSKPVGNFNVPPQMLKAINKV